MKKLTKLWPREGTLVKDPETRRPLPASGADVDLAGKHGTYWRRRLLDGDAFDADPQKKPSRSRSSED